MGQSRMSRYCLFSSRSSSGSDIRTEASVDQSIDTDDDHAFDQHLCNDGLLAVLQASRICPKLFVVSRGFGTNAGVGRACIDPVEQTSDDDHR